MISPSNRYTQMQNDFYEDSYEAWSAQDPHHVVGNFDRLNGWDELYDTLFDGMGDLSDKVALDFACGPGRSLVLLHDKFKRIDGADISEVAINGAKDWIKHNDLDTDNFTLYVNNGIDLEGVPSDSYDVVMCVIAFHHICVHEIRYKLLQEFHRVLKPGGWIAVQMIYGDAPDTSRCTDYSANFYDAPGTNSVMDARVLSPTEPECDLKSIGYKNFRYHIISNLLPGPLDDPDFFYPSVIVFKGQK